VVARGPRYRWWEAARDCTRICLWGLGHLKTRSVWDLLQNKLGISSRAFLAITKIQRVHQRDGTIRFDIYIEPNMANRVLKSIRIIGRRQKIHVRNHRDRRQRTHVRNHSYRYHRIDRVDNSPKSIPSSGDFLRIASWNINGIRHKLADVEYFLQRNKPHLVGFQETVQPENSWPREIFLILVNIWINPSSLSILSLQDCSSSTLFSKSFVVRFCQ